MQKLTILLLFFTGIFNQLLAQHSEKVTYGIKAAGLLNSISNLPEMIIGRDNNLATYTIESQGSYGYEAGFFLNYKLPDSRVALHTELLFRKSGETVSYKSVAGKEYELVLDYSYLSLGALYKIYPLKGVNIGVGSFYSINMNPNNLGYSSNENQGLNDVSIRQFYRDGITGRDDFSVCFALGYELEKSLHFDIRYYFGVSDIIENREASFQFLENKNRSSVLSLSIGYSFDKW